MPDEVKASGGSLEIDDMPCTHYTLDCVVQEVIQILPTEGLLVW